LVAVDGHNLHIYCVGSGNPVIVLEPGMGSDWVAWRPVISKLAARDEVCVYDRAGYGWSDSGPMPRTALRIATELHELLTKSQIPGPYLLLAHSFGGYIARMYADRFPDSLRGIVMVDPLQEEDGHEPDPAPRFTFSVRGLVSLLPPLGSERLERLYKGESALPVELKNAPAAYQRRFLIASPLSQLKSERNEFESLPLTEVELRGARFPEDLPLTVVTAVRLENGEMHRARQAKLAHLSRRGKQIVAESSGHSVQLFEPGLIVEAVREMIEEGR
jgi:pimeloyl-ACP methyl ester carboxylesterase